MASELWECKITSKAIITFLKIKMINYLRRWDEEFAFHKASFTAFKGLLYAM